MNTKIARAAARIGRQVPATEACLDEALIQISSLITQLVTARQETGVPASTGQTTIARLTKAQAALLTASSDVLRAHKDLALIAEVHAGMDLHECPKAEIVSNNVTKLAIAS